MDSRAEIQTQALQRGLLVSKEPSSTVCQTPTLASWFST